MHVEGLDCIPDLVRAGTGDGIFECLAGQRAALCDRFRSQNLPLRRHVCMRMGFQQGVPELRGGSMPGLITARVRQLSRCCARSRSRPNACTKPCLSPHVTCCRRSSAQLLEAQHIGTDGEGTARQNWIAHDGLQARA